MNIKLEPGILIAIEGIDGTGKSTQAGLLADALEQIGLVVCRTREPTAGRWGMELRRSATEGRLSPERELELFMLDRKEHVETCIGPALARGEVVITDRYYFSTVAYQGARGFDPDALLAQNEDIAPQPDVLLILDLPVEEALARIREGREETDAFEQASMLEGCQRIFRSIASRTSQGYVLDARGEVREIVVRLLGHVVDEALGLRLETVLGKDQATDVVKRLLAA